MARTSEPRRGVWLFPSVPAPALVDAIVAAEEAGLDEIWLADEGVAREPTAVFAAAATRTRRIRLCVGVTSPVLRHPGAIAAAAATLAELSSGRFVLGLGVGGHLALEPFGLEADRPVRRMADAIRICRAVWSGEATVGYDPPPHGFSAPEIPLWLGARGPQLTTLAARSADGLFLSGCSPQQHDEILSRTPQRAVTIYQSVAEARSGDSSESDSSVFDWDSVGAVLAEQAARHRPAALGLNLVETVPPDGPIPAGSGNLGELIARAGALLGSLRPAPKSP